MLRWLGRCVTARTGTMIEFAGAAATWVDREIAGCEFRDARLGKRFRTLLERISSDIGQSIPFVVPGLHGELRRRPTVFLPIIASGEADIFVWPFPIHARERSGSRTILFSVLQRHDRVHLSTGQTGTDRDYEVALPTAKTRSGWQSQNVHGLWNLDAFEPCDYDRGITAGIVRGKILDSRQVQGNRGAQRKHQSNAGPHREEREHPMAGELKTVHRNSRRSGTLHPYRRP